MPSPSAPTRSFALVASSLLLAALCVSAAAQTRRLEGLVEGERFSRIKVAVPDAPASSGAPPTASRISTRSASS